MKRFGFLCTTGLSVVLPACGSLDSNTNSPPTLATLQGTVLNPNSLDVSTSSAVRVAVVWRGGGPEQFNVAEDLPVQPVFPSAFTIAFTAPPPAAAMNAESNLPIIWCVPDSGIPESPLCASLDGGRPSKSQTSEGGPPLSGPDAQGVAAPPNGDDDEAGVGLSPAATPPDTPTNASPEGQYAVGTVVAYLDLNHNGKLDLVSEDASAYVDQIIAANQDMTIVYVQGPITDGLFAPVEDALGHRPTDGYNLLLDPCSALAPQLYYPACPTAPAQDAGSCSTPVQWLGMGTPYPLTVASSPEVASLMCLAQTPGFAAGSGPAGPYNPAIQPVQYPSPSDPGVCCASDGSDYVYTTCADISRGLCQGMIESCTSVGYERPTPVPATWPCSK